MSVVSKGFEVIGMCGAGAFVISVGMVITASTMDDVQVNMPIDGCYTRIEGSKHSVHQTFNCQFTDPRTNEHVENSYHPLAYKEMDSYPKGTKFTITAESMEEKSLGKKGAVAMIGGIALAVIGLIGMICCETTRKDQRW